MIPQGFKNIERILASFLGESKSGISDTGQLQFPCPKCVEEKGEKEIRKYNLEVNLFRQVYKCWSCSSVDDSMTGKLSKLIKKYGNMQLYEAYRREIDDLIKSKLYDINAFVTDFEDTESVIRLPQSFTKIDLATCTNMKLVNYLASRKIDQNIINKYNLGYTTWNDPDSKWRNRLIIPSYDEFSDLNYFVGRDIGDKKTGMKYLNCLADKKNIVFQESTIDFDADIILCEGAIDCLYPTNAIALLGKVLKKDYKIFQTLMRRANGNIIICLDSDTDIKETKRIYNLLNSGRLRNHVLYIRMDAIKDIGELYEKYGKRGIISAIRSARQFSDLDLLFE